MPSEDKFLELLNQLTHAHKVQLDVAYERGRAAGRREARAKLREEVKSLRDLLEDDADEIDEAGEANEEDTDSIVWPGQDSDQGHRAPPGSVKPIISDLIHKRPGLMTVEIREITKLKHNSIRGTLWILSAQDKVIERRDRRWYPVAQKEEAAGTVSEQDAPTASEPEHTEGALFD